jgi:Tfp pilus assembly PilM family ATPase
MTLSAVTFPNEIVPTQSTTETDEISAAGSQRHTPEKQLPTEGSRRKSHHQSGWSPSRISSIVRDIEQITSPAKQFRTAQVNVMLSMSACDYRTLYIPQENRVTRATVQHAIEEATEDSRPRCMAILQGDEKRSPDKSHTASHSKIRCLSIPEDLSWALSDELDAIGLTPQRLDGLPWCMANALELCTATLNERQITIGIDLGYGNPTLIAMRNGQIDYLRCLSCGGIGEIALRASQELGLSIPEAIRLLERGADPRRREMLVEVDGELQERFTEYTEKLASEVTTALDFIQWRNQDCSIEQLWIMGGGAQLPTIMEMLQSKIPIPTAAWHIRVGDFELTSEYAQAAALALSEGWHA